jgi:hypothetical protein
MASAVQLIAQTAGREGDTTEEWLHRTLQLLATWSGAIVSGELPDGATAQNIELICRDFGWTDLDRYLSVNLSEQQLEVVIPHEWLELLHATERSTEAASVFMYLLMCVNPDEYFKIRQ